ncbi:MAG: Mu-like prophage major head subunit gpT family protein [Planctomycetes bacterium]|nr:Mu-like prophage major head subunit gpT family protein [Planctomycetota bacterium]
MTIETTAVAAPPETLNLVADVALSAAGSKDKLPAVQIVAYGGGVMTVPGWGDIVIDLAGLDVTGSVALLSDHDSTRRGVVGHGRAEVAGGRLTVAGTISATTAAAREIVESARNGFAWEASVGLEVHERRRVAAGEVVAVNGRTIRALANGFTLVSRGRLREVSIVALGCDGGTSVSIAAQKRTEGVMVTTATVEQDVVEQQTRETETATLEAGRVEAIRKICAGRFPEIEERAVAEQWDTNRVELEVLRASRPKVPAAYIPDQHVPTSASLEAAILMRMGKGGLGEKVLGAPAMEAGERLGAAHLMDICRAALLSEHRDVPHGRLDMVRAALSTMSLPTALGAVANKLLLDSYNETPATWRSFCAVRSVSDFKTNTAIRPSFTGALQPVAPGGELKHGSVAESTTTFSVDTYGKLLSVDRRDIINDDMGLFQDAASAHGRAAMRSLNDLVYAVLLANASGFFSEGNGNYQDGADSALGFDALAAAILLMRSQRDDEHNDLDLRPAVLLVGPGLESTARALLQSEYIQQTVGQPTGNSLRQAVTLEIEPRLSNTAKFGAAASGKEWFLFTNPAFAALVVAFLNGIQTPTTEFFGLEQTVERLAVSWRVFFDYGAALCDPRAAVMSKGQA